MLEPVTIELTTPIKDFGRVITQIACVRESNGKDLVDLDGTRGATRTLRFIQRLCVTPEHADKAGNPHRLSWEAVQELTNTDIGSITNAMLPFLGVDPSALNLTPSMDF
jgi:hypothetical protein